MSIKLTAVIKRESKVDPKNPHQTNYYASLQLFSEDGKEYGLPRYFSGYQEVGNLLEREAGVAHDQLQDRHVRYERDEEVRISLTLESEEAIKNLGFSPKAA